MGVPKKIFFLWIGDEIPEYAENSFAACAKTNRECESKFVKIGIKRLNAVLDGKPGNFEYRNLLEKSVHCVLGESEYGKFVETQKKIYGKNVRFIQILSDVMRLELINEFGGIYCDCDVYPIRPFDDSLFERKSFVVSRFYGADCWTEKHFEYIDNYFMGTDGTNRISDPSDDGIDRIIQTNERFENDVGYIYRRKKFYEGRLEKADFDVGKSVKNFYVEHYHANSWNFSKKSNLIKTGKCAYDEILKRRIDVSAS